MFWVSGGRKTNVRQTVSDTTLYVVQRPKTRWHWQLKVWQCQSWHNQLISK